VNIVADGLLTSYKLSGSKKDRLVVLLHGWGDSSHGLDGLQKQLSVHYRVLTVDLPGFGGTELPNSSWNLDDYARFVRAVLDKLELEQPYAVIGHSNGGALAIRAVSLSTLRPQKLVLLAASGIRTAGKGRRLALQTLAKTGNVATLWMPDRYRQGLRRSLYGAAGSDLLVVPELEATFKRVVRQDVQADAAAIDQPTLLVYATDDQSVPLAVGRSYQRLIKHARLEIIENSGHFVHLEQADTVTKLIEEFLK
jgi:pimeloyl-ACP methyl ester carboxylesterase